MYRTEIAFSRALNTAFRPRNVMVQRIENGALGRGMPDIMIASHNGVQFIELKNMPYQSLAKEIVVPWRAGQQAWAHRLHTASHGEAWVFTIIALKTEYLIIPMHSRFVKNIVTPKDYKIRYSLAEVVEYLVGAP